MLYGSVLITFWRLLERQRKIVGYFKLTLVVLVSWALTSVCNLKSFVVDVVLISLDFTYCEPYPSIR